MAPKYEQVARTLRRAISDGRYAPGAKLPSYTELRHLHSVAQATIDKAFDLLQREGLIERRRRSGIFVAENPDVSDRAEPGSLVSESVLILSNVSARALYRMGHGGWSAAIPNGALGAAQDAGRPAFILGPPDLTPRRMEELRQFPPAVVAAIECWDQHGNLPPHIRDFFATIDVPCGACACGESGDALQVDHDQRDGARQLTNWLMDQGCRRILMLAPHTHADLFWWSDRVAGYEAACVEHGVTPLPQSVIPPGHRSWRGQEGFDDNARRLCGYLAEFVTGTDTPVDALMAPSDGTVFFVAAALRMLGKEPGKDILITGYDNYWGDSRESKFTSALPAATIDKKNFDLGARLVEELIKSEQGLRVKQQQRVKGELILPAAVGALAAG